MTELPPTNAIAIDNFLFCPPDKCIALVYLFSFNPKSFKTFNISFSLIELFTDLNTQNISRWSCTVKSLNNTSCCGHIPTTFLNLSKPSGVNILYELYNIEPDVAEINPVNIFINVLFPAPLWPNKTNISFLYIFRDTSFKAILSPNFL